MTRPEPEQRIDPTPNLDHFIEAYNEKGDGVLDALTLEQLEAAWDEAEFLVGWQVCVHEYLHAKRDGKGLNRPL